jgi:hypothetical protein
MRRVILAVLFCLAACGGEATSPGAINPQPSSVSARQRYLLSAEAQAVIADLARTFSQDAIHSCLSAWVTDAGGPAVPDGTVSKPDVGDFAGFRAFLRECLGAAPGDARDPNESDARRLPTGRSN